MTRRGLASFRFWIRFEVPLDQGFAQKHRAQGMREVGNFCPRNIQPSFHDPLAILFRITRAYYSAYDDRGGLGLIGRQFGYC